MDNQGLQLLLFKNGRLVNVGQGNTVTLVTKENVKAGDYKVAFSDGINRSELVDVPEIILNKAIEKPTNVKVVTSSKKATISAE